VTATKRRLKLQQQDVLSVQLNLLLLLLLWPEDCQLPLAAQLLLMQSLWSTCCHFPACCSLQDAAAAGHCQWLSAAIPAVAVAVLALLYCCCCCRYLRRC
jgi:hypothetical protein